MFVAGRPGFRGGTGSAGTAKEGVAPPVALHLGHGQAPLKKKRAGARPKRAAAGVPFRESLAVFRWRTPADREIAVVAAILPSCRARGKGNPLSRTSAPRSFRKSGPFPAEKRGIGAWPPPLLTYPELRPKSYAAPHVIAWRGAETGPLAGRANVVPYLRLLKTGDRIPDGTFYPLLAVLQIRCTFSETLESARKFDF